MFVVGLGVAFWYSWKLTLVICSLFPLIITAGVALNKLLVQGNTKSQKLYADAGAVSDEAISMIRTVVSFGTQQLDSER